MWSKGTIRPNDLSEGSTGYGVYGASSYTNGTLGTALMAYKRSTKEHYRSSPVLYGLLYDIWVPFSPLQKDFHGR